MAMRCVVVLAMSLALSSQYVLASGAPPAATLNDAEKLASGPASGREKTSVLDERRRDGGAALAQVSASFDVQHIASWVVDSNDSGSLPFIIVDKIHAKIFIFNAGGALLGAAPALLGYARGDDTVPGIGDRKLSDIRPEERTTPAGRFVSARGMTSRGEDVYWVEYESGVSLHRVITTNPLERRLERLATPTAADNRISYGCINVPAAIYDAVINPLFIRNGGIVYVLPETRSVRRVFGSYDVPGRLP